MSGLIRISIFCLILGEIVQATLLSALFGQNTFNFPGALESSIGRRRCPLCDNSVYSYCSDRLFHDSCCCHNPNNPYDQRPYECQYADCSFLHANTCQEHKLITACCCINHVY